MGRFPKSLAFRVTLLSTVLVVTALFVIATVIDTLYGRASERNFDQLLSAHLFNLIGSVGLDSEGRLDGSPDFGDIRYSQPGSGWYWSVEPVTGGIDAPLSSPSLTGAIPSPSAGDVPFDPFFRRSYVTDGLAGEKVRVFESEFELGGTGAAARFRLMGNESELRADIAAFRHQVWTYFAILGLALVAINAAAMRYGLRPLDRVRKALGDIREGRAQRLEGPFPHEIEPLADEMNALIENNRRIVERSRTQVGNLAHSLKTPLAVIVNEGHALGGGKGRVIGQQAEAMRAQVEHYLQRARIAAQRESVVFRADATAVLARMARVVAKLHPGKDIAADLPERPVIFAGEQQDLEEIVGNLLENAVKWSRASVALALSEEPGNRLVITVADDGPGIPPERAAEALKRGRRLDERMPGTGLGLSIVAELVNEYGGRLSLGEAGLGGLEARVELPMAKS
ncbi:MAG: histidine kinase [Phyllobacteriaceae bacterium]|nr:histidine kinase [Phyllobacteriaceae bacterium]MBA89285.1 histidine kinase [Phyllobacteriaceae bacterium]